MSLVLSVVRTFETLSNPDLAISWIQSHLMDRCFTRPTPCLPIIPIEAVLSTNSSVVNGMESSSRRDPKNRDSATAVNAAMSSASPVERAITGCVRLCEWATYFPVPRKTIPEEVLLGLDQSESDITVICSGRDSVGERRSASGTCSTRQWFRVSF